MRLQRRSDDMEKMSTPLSIIKQRATYIRNLYLKYSMTNNKNNEWFFIIVEHCTN